MGQLIAEFGGKYCEWNTVVDAPVTYLLTEDELRAHLHTQYGDDDLLDSFDERMSRVRRQGCSGDNCTRADLLLSNRAGPGESHLPTEEDFVLHYSGSQVAQADAAAARPVPPAPSLSKPFLCALQTGGPVEQALHILLARCHPEALEALLHRACEDAMSGRVPGDDAHESFRQLAHTLISGGLEEHETLLLGLLLDAGERELRFIFSNEIVPCVIAAKASKKQASASLADIELRLASTNAAMNDHPREALPVSSSAGHELLDAILALDTE